MRRGKEAGIAKVMMAGGPVRDGRGRLVSHAGMGIVVGPRHVLTCAHVVNAAVGLPVDSSALPAQAVRVLFPLSASDTPVEGRVVAWQPMGTKPVGDVAVIEFGEAVPRDVGVATISDADGAFDDHALKVFGVPAGSDSGHTVDAKVMGRTNARTVEIAGTSVLGVFIEGGYSGAAVWDTVLQEVVGIVSELYDVDRAARLAYMIPASAAREVWPGLVADAGGATPGPRPPQWRLVSQKTENFVGRGYAFDFFDEFFSAHASGYVVVEGVPGIGKSSLLAEFARRSLAPAHFNVRAEGIVSVAQFVESLHAQLGQRFELDLALPESAARDGRHVEHLLEESAKRLAPGERLVVVVDALDEVEPSGSVGANPLFLPTSLPGGVFLLVSCRAHTAVLQVEDNIGLLDLMAHAADNRNDAEQFIRASLGTSAAGGGLGDAAAFETLVGHLLERSEYNFMYLHYVLRDIEQGRLRGGALHDLPFGLRGYYERHWQKMTAGRAGDKPRFRTIYALAELGHPVTASLISACIGEEELTVHRFLDEWAQFLEIGRSAERVGERPARLFSLYHKSFADFLAEKGTIQAAGVDLGDLRRRVGDGLLGGFDLDG